MPRDLASGKPGLSRNLVLSLFFLLLRISPVSAQQQPAAGSFLDLEPAYFLYGEEEGLSHAYVFSILHDSRGRVWVGTSSGPAFVNDRKRIAIAGIEYQDQIADSLQLAAPVFEMVEDEKGTIWFANMNHQVFSWDGVEFRPYAFQDSLLAHLPKRRYIDDFNVVNGHVYVSYKGIDVHHFDSTGRWSPLPFLPATTDTLDLRIARLPGQHVAAMSKRPRPKGAPPYQHVRIQHLIPGRDQNPVEILAPFRHSEKSGRNWRVYSVSLGDSLVVGYQNNLYLTVGDRLLEAIELEDAIQGMSLDNRGRLWLAGSQGVRVYRLNHLRAPEHHWFKDQRINLKRSLHDFEGGIWLSSLRKGLLYLPHPDVYHLRPDQTDGQPVMDMVDGDQGSLYLGLGPNQFIRADANGDTLHFHAPRENHSDPDAGTLHYDRSSNQLLFFRGENVVIYRLEGRKMEEIDVLPWAMAFVLPPQGPWYFADQSNVWSYQDGQIENLPALPEQVLDIHDLLMRKDGTLLVATSSNIYAWSGQEWEQQPVTTEKAGTIDQMEDGTLLFGTQQDGLKVIGKKGTSTFNLGKLGPTRRNQLFRCGMLIPEEPNRVFFHSSGALQMIQMGEDDTLHSRLYLDAGVPNLQKGYSLHKGERFISVVVQKGLVRVDRRMFEANQHVHLPLTLEGLKIGGQDTLDRDSFALISGQNRLWFRLRSISYRSASQHTFRYRLNGLETEWTVSTNPEVQYTALPPGEYTFEARVRNLDGSWSNHHIDRYFIVPTPVWSTWWFRSLVVLVLIGLIFLAWRWQLQRIRERNTRTNQLLQFQQQSLASQMNPHFIFNAMNSIQGFMIQRETQEAMRYLSRFGQLTRRVMDQSAREFISLEEELETLRKYLELEALRFDGRFTWSISCPPELESSDLQLPGLIIQPHVENALWHGLMPKTSGDRLLTIRFSLIHNVLRCEVEDNGIGREAAKQKSSSDHTSVGMSKTAKRLELLGQKHRKQFSVDVTDLIRDQHPTGTRVTLAFPQFG